MVDATTKTISLTLAVSCLLASSAAWSQGYAAHSGAELFQQFCAACHGTDGRGGGPVAGSLATLVPDLTRLSERHDGRFPAAEVREIIDGRAVVIAHGTRFMPVWGYEFWIEEGADVVAEEEARIIIDRLVDYLGSIQERIDPAEPRP
jgi:mono/diheme cytochrome c family protein